MLELINGILMIDGQLKSSFIKDKERKDLLKSKLNKLEKLSQLVAGDISTTNCQLKFSYTEELVEDESL